MNTRPTILDRAPLPGETVRFEWTEGAKCMWFIFSDYDDEPVGVKVVTP